MLELNTNEIQAVSGADALDALIFACDVVSALSRPRVREVVDFVPVYTDVYTPKYGFWGDYEGEVCTTYLDYAPVKRYEYY